MTAYMKNIRSIYGFMLSVVGFSLGGFLLWKNFFFCCQLIEVKRIVIDVIILTFSIISAWGFSSSYRLRNDVLEKRYFFGLLGNNYFYRGELVGIRYAPNNARPFSMELMFSGGRKISVNVLFIGFDSLRRWAEQSRLGY
ncbi:MAG: hypothetical protein IJI03_17100 [Rudaea sp.]|nr:hypothetical protein [Rudaea sp.]